jgi:DNA-binding beta-propeller fold protein YncE
MRRATTRTRRSTLGLVGLLVAVDVAVFSFVACGARTELPVLGGPGEGGAGGGPATGGGGAGATGGGGAGGELPDAPPDVPEDVVPDCADPSSTFVYLVTSEQDLYSFNPANNAFTLRGFVDCPNPNGASPFSMGVDRKGTAYVLYNDGNLYRVSTKDASCEETEFEPGQLGFDLFGMGFALDEPNGRTDSLYVAEISFDQPSLGLGRIDTDSLELSYVGGFADPPGNVLELTSSSDGNLYGYFLAPNGGTVVELDKNDATILSETFLSVGNQASALAFAWWSGDFYIFTAPAGSPTTVTRYRPTDQSVSVVATLPRTVVGAGVSTCAPR